MAEVVAIESAIEPAIEPAIAAAELFTRRVRDHINVIEQLIDSRCLSDIAKVAIEISVRLAGGAKIFFFGNGGSSMDAGHLAAEFPREIRFRSTGNSWLVSRRSDSSLDRYRERLWVRSGVFTSVGGLGTQWRRRHWAYDERQLRQCLAGCQDRA